MQAENDPYFGALCLLAARGVEPSDHALAGALVEWKTGYALRRFLLKGP